MELIAEGRDALVYALDGGRVLRRSRNGSHRCEAESATMEWARKHGYPVPRLYSVDGPEMVFERVEGVTMLSSLVAGTTDLADAGRTLAALLTQLHEIAPPPNAPVTGAIRHRDLHPGNVMLSPAGPVVIDWANSDVGRAEVDVALTALILAQVASVEGALAVPAGVVLESFLDHAGPIDRADAEAAASYRAGDPNQTPAELAVLSEAVRLVSR